MAERWIQSAIRRPGALRKQLGIPEGQKIPVAMLRSAAKEPGKLGQRARLALRLRGFASHNPRRRRAARARKGQLINAKLKRLPNGSFKVFVSPGTLVRMRLRNPDSPKKVVILTRGIGLTPGNQGMTHLTFDAKTMGFFSTPREAADFAKQQGVDLESHYRGAVKAARGELKHTFTRKK